MPDSNAANSMLVAVLLVLTSGCLAVSRNWRVSLAALTLQVAGVAMLVGDILPARVALVKLVAGWSACGILFLACRHNVLRRGRSVSAPVASTFGYLPFRLIAAVMVAIVASVASQAPSLALPGLASGAKLACVAMLAMALLHLGTTEEPVQVGIGLLTLLAGFEILYAALEPSIMVIGLLALVTITLAWTLSALAMRSAARTADGVTA